LVDGGEIIAVWKPGFLAEWLHGFRGAGNESADHALPGLLRVSNAPSVVHRNGFLKLKMS
jgi:hypothetical protein